MNTLSRLPFNPAILPAPPAELGDEDAAVLPPGDRSPRDPLFGPGLLLNKPGRPDKLDTGEPPEPMEPSELAVDRGLEKA